jgi:L-asparagine transporter-like permease
MRRAVRAYPAHRQAAMVDIRQSYRRAGRHVRRAGYLATLLLSVAFTMVSAVLLYEPSTRQAYLTSLPWLIVLLAWALSCG